MFLTCQCEAIGSVLTCTCLAFAVDSTEAPTFETPLEAMWDQLPEDHTVDFLSVL